MSSGLRRTGRRSEATTFAGGRLPQFATARQLDLDAARYLAAVEAVDEARLEPAVRAAVNTFVVGCKADGIWTAIKASCVLLGARTLSGALVPLVGETPTIVNFVSGDYSRRLGLLGNGSTKYLNTNRLNNADPQDSKHIAAYISAAATGNTTQVFMGSDSSATPGTTIFYKAGSADGSDDRFLANVNQDSPPVPEGAGANTGFSTGFMGVSRAASTGFTGRVGGADTSYTQTSEAPSSSAILLFARTASSPARHTNARIAFYSIGQSLSLAQLDARVTALATAVAGAIP